MKKRPPRDPNLLAKFILDETMAEPQAPAEVPAEKNPAAVALGRLGGLKGGRARADKLTAEERSKIAKKAAASRWKKRS